MLQAAAMGVLLRGLLGLEPAGSRHAPRIVLVAGALGAFVTFVTIAVPVQFERQWVMVGWAVEGVALACAYTLTRRRPLLWAALALMAASVSKGFLPDMARLGGLLPRGLVRGAGRVPCPRRRGPAAVRLRAPRPLRRRTGTARRPI